MRKEIYLNRIEEPIIWTVQHSARPVEFAVMDSDLPAGATARLFVKLPSGAVESGSCSISGNVITAALTAAMTREPGNALAQIEIDGGGARIYTFTSIIAVQENVGASDASTMDIYVPKGREAVTLKIAVNGRVEIGWGDGSGSVSEASDLTTLQSIEHEYAAPGPYRLTIRGGDYAILGSNTSAVILSGSDNYATNSLRKSIGNISLGPGLVSIGEYGLTACSSIRKVTLPETLTEIGAGAFYNCFGLNEIELPEGLTSIGTTAFSFTYGLGSITIPASVTTFGSRLFTSSNLTELHMKAATPPTIQSDTLQGFTGAIYVPAASVAAYKAASNWSSYSSQIQGE